MAKDEPTNGELKIMLDALTQRSDEKHSTFETMLKEIKDVGQKTLEQAQKTNGRVSKLEYWQSALKWGFGVVMMFIVPLVVKAFLK